MEDHRDNYINGDPDKRDLYNMLRVLRLDNKVRAAMCFKSLCVPPQA